MAAGPGEVPTAWLRLLRVHAFVTRELDARLLAAHGVSLHDYEVLLFLSWAPNHRLRRVDLAQRLLLTPSGIARRLEGLEQAGLVDRARSTSDGRVVYAHLTDAGLNRLREAATTHANDVRSLFTDRFSDEERDLLAGLLERLPGGDITPYLRHPAR